MASWIDQDTELYIEILAYPDSVAFAVGTVEAIDEEVIVTLNRRQVRVLHRLLTGWLEEIDEADDENP